jgi:DNA-directed RNA polymerase specialized sigma24 family protein
MDAPHSSQVDWQQIDWQPLLSKLTACALRWFRMEGCYEADSVLPGTGMSAVDLVYDTVLSVLADDATARLVAVGGDPFPFILTALRHNFLDLVKQGREYHRTLITDAANDSRANGEVERDVCDADGFALVGAAVLVRKLHVILGNDAELKDYVSAWLLKGLEKRADIAYHLGVSEQEITNRKRRLIYKLKPYKRMFVEPQAREKKYG